MRSASLFFLTQHAGLPLQKWQDVFVEEQGAEAEEVPEAQVGHRAPIPYPRLSLNHCGLCDCDLENLLPWQALTAGEHHSLLSCAERRQDAPQRVPGIRSAARHCPCRLRASGALQEGDGREVRGLYDSFDRLVHLLSSDSFWVLQWLLRTRWHWCPACSTWNNKYLGGEHTA